MVVALHFVRCDRSRRGGIGNSSRSRQKANTNGRGQLQPSPRLRGGSMKRHALATMLSLLLTPALVPLYAQSLKFVVPFDFAAAQATLPAGEYHVSSNVPAQGMIRLSGANGSSNAICFASGIESGSPSDKAKLVFNRYGDRYFLSQVWSGGGNN